MIWPYGLITYKKNHILFFLIPNYLDLLSTKKSAKYNGNYEYFLKAVKHRKNPAHAALN